jgi:superfamily II DNA or RNA helicase/ribosomal protein S15P/S13E
MSFAVGSLVRARGREWVVLPESEEELLVVRPLGGTDDETTGIFMPLEPVESARFAPPDPRQAGDNRSSRLLRDAVRLGFRASAGPFRSFARLGVEPRPYQLVPLLMALSLEPVRLLIADDVGIGKTVEACLVARELIDRGEVERLAVLCPPHLAEQWQAELRDKFHVDAELVLPSTARRLSQACRPGESIFDYYPHVVVSTDFIKSDSRRDEFLRTCPELVIVDEAHTCASGADRNSGRHQRHQLVKGLAAKETRHMILVTATPHSGNEEAFRSLLALLNPDFADLPEDLTGKENERRRRELARHFVQRRRGDIVHYLDADTPFPEREEGEDAYKLHEDYKRLFDRVLRYARETVSDPAGGDRRRQRVRWWSALALLRSLASSPAAAAATLRTRAASADTDTAAEADEVGRRSVLDLIEDVAADGLDVTPGGYSGEDDESQSGRRRLLEMARQAEGLLGSKDAKLQKTIRIVKGLVADGFRPIVFCRYIATADYVADALRGALRGVEVAAVTGSLAPAEREDRIAQLVESPGHVLVATDCLSEGINLQEHFDAVVHYDLSWNPTRHEQREGRVDRYGQPSPRVKVVTVYGVDNQIDGIVLDVLIRKHKKIRSSLGVSVPVPVDTDQVIDAIFEGVLLREGRADADTTQSLLPGFEDAFTPQKEELFKLWDTVADREKRSRTMFAQETIKVEDVARELREARAAVGAGVDVKGFTVEALKASGAAISQNGSVRMDLRETPRALREALGYMGDEIPVLHARFELPVKEKQVYLTRTHPLVEGLASYVMETALDPAVVERVIARRCGAVRTREVEKRTTALLLRFRYHILVRRGEEEKALLAEDCRILAYGGPPQAAQWLAQDRAEALLLAEVGENIEPEQARDFARRAVEGLEHLGPHMEDEAKRRGAELLESHRRVRNAARMRGVQYRIEPQLPPDVLGVYVYLPMR